MARRRCRRWRGRCSAPGTTSTSPDGTSPRISTLCAASHPPCWARCSLNWPSGWTFGSSCGPARRFPAFHPTRSEVRDGIRNLVRSTRIRCEPDPREHPFHRHHAKTIVIDGQVAFVGGIDMTDDAGDRFDSPAHPARRALGWHDVAARLRGAGRGRCRRALQHALAGADW